MRLRRFFWVSALMLTVLLLSCKSQQSATDTSRRPVAVSPGGSGMLDDPQRIDEMYVEATTFMIRGDYQTAKERFLQLLEKDPNHHAARYNLARMALTGRSFDDAIRYGTEALASDRNNYWYYQVLAQAYAGKGAYEQAIELQEEMTQRFPDRLSDFMQLVDWQVRNQQLDAAVSTLIRAQGQFPNRPDIPQKQYELYAAQSKWQDALKVAEQLAETGPDNPFVGRWQYEALMQLGQEEAAIEALRRVKQANPDDAFALLTLAEYQAHDYLQKDVDELAIESLRPIMANPDLDPQKKTAILEGLLEKADPTNEQMIADIKALGAIIQKIHPNSGAGLTLTAQLSKLSGSTDSTLILYRQSLEANPQDLDLWKDLLEQDWLTYQWNHLYQDAEEALTYYPSQDLFNLYFALGAVYRNRWRQAENTLEKIVRMDKADAPIRREVSALMLLQKILQNKVDEPLEDLEAIAQANPDEARLAHHFSYALLMREQDPAKALKFAKKASKLDPEAGVYQFQEGFATVRSGKVDDGLNLIAQANRNTRTPALLEAWGDVLFELDRVEEAKQKWQTALEQGAELSPAKREMIGE